MSNAIVSFVKMIVKIVLYIIQIFKGLFDIVVDKDESIYDGKGKIVSKLPSTRKQFLIFVKNFFKDPVMLGSVVPTSQFVINKLLAPIDFANTKIIVEYGPGVGNISIEILKRMRKDAKLITFELNENLANFCKKEFEDNRFFAYGQSAADVKEVLLREHGIQPGQVDYVISGIPFSTIPPAIGASIVDATRAILRPGGKFLIYQFKSKVLELIEPRFTNIERDFELINFPPYKVYQASY